MTRRLQWAVAGFLAAAAVACAADPQQRAPAAPDDGIQLTGRFEGRNLSVSAGEPTVVHGDCDPLDGADVDLCVVTATIDGRSFALVIENPFLLEAGASVPVRHSACVAAACDLVTDGAVVELRLDGDRHRATSGSLQVREAGPRYAVSFVLRFRAGNLSGSFNVLPGEGS